MSWKSKFYQENYFRVQHPEEKINFVLWWGLLLIFWVKREKFWTDYLMQKQFNENYSKNLLLALKAHKILRVYLLVNFIFIWIAKKFNCNLKFLWYKFSHFYFVFIIIRSQNYHFFYPTYHHQQRHRIFVDTKNPFGWIVIITTWFWIKRIKKTWQIFKKSHYFGYLIYFFVINFFLFQSW